MTESEEELLVKQERIEVLRLINNMAQLQLQRENASGEALRDIDDMLKLLNHEYSQT